MTELRSVTVSLFAAEYSRRHALKIGGGVLALVIGGTAGWLDRRGDDSPPVTASPDTALRSEASPASGTSQRPTTPATNPPAPAGLLESLDTEAIADLDLSIADLGHRYLAANPAEASLTVLIGLLVDPSSDRIAGPLFDPMVAASTMISEDFQNGDTVSVDGWVLAASEARAAGVVALVCATTGGETIDPDTRQSGPRSC